MAERHVTRSRKDADGDITALCNPASTGLPELRPGRSKTSKPAPTGTTSPARADGYTSTS